MTGNSDVYASDDLRPLSSRFNPKNLLDLRGLLGLCGSGEVGAELPLAVDEVFPSADDLPLPDCFCKNLGNFDWGEGEGGEAGVLRVFLLDMKKAENISMRHGHIGNANNPLVIGSWPSGVHLSRIRQTKVKQIACNVSGSPRARSDRRASGEKKNISISSTSDEKPAVLK